MYGQLIAIFIRHLSFHMEFRNKNETISWVRIDNHMVKIIILMVPVNVSKKISFFFFSNNVHKSILKAIYKLYDKIGC